MEALAAMDVPKLKTMQVHCCAVRLCALVYFFAFLGNVVDGPIIWLVTPPTQYSAAQLVTWSQVALLPAALAFLRPWCWPALAFCWWVWHWQHRYGGVWFFFGWDAMMDEIGFLACVLSATLTLYDDVDVEGAEAVADFPLEPSEPPSEHLEDQETQPALQPEGNQGSTLRSRRKRPPSQDDSPEAQADLPSTSWWQMLWVSTARKSPSRFQPCKPIVDWCRTIAELSLTLAGFRLFLAAGLLKRRVGSACWKDLTCLYDHYETQPMPNLASWYFHNFTPHGLMRLMQWFAIDLAECMVPFLLLGFLVSMGPLGLLHDQLLCSEQWFLRVPAKFPGRLVGASVIMTFVFGMFVGGNYAFLHPLAVVSLVASLGTVRGLPVTRRPSPALMLYQSLMPWLLILLLLFAFLPSLRAYAWLWSGSERVGFLEPLMQSDFVMAASGMNLGIPYNRHAYFAGMVHDRKEMVLFADVGDGYVEMDIPYKVGSVGRAPLQTSPLHRRFAWQWWFLGLGQDPSWLVSFMEQLCSRSQTAWAAVENNSTVHDNLDKLKKVAVQMYQYHFSKPGSQSWWERHASGQRMEIAC
ncbi:unnamed protein product [Effrenium voratum]|uniref:Lipase maturation factor n=2 Tax=Effrenium voratum TaxID=2562239 RepID=A0AA36ILB8_9DINO|nr:unnamed protein product [Effrenium voratum]